MNEYGLGSNNHMPRKGYGRIFVEKEEDIDKVREIMKEIDEYEVDYCPAGLVAVFEGKMSVVYTHKFDSIDMNELMIRCWNKGIKAFYIM